MCRFGEHCYLYIERMLVVLNVLWILYCDEYVIQRLLILYVDGGGIGNINVAANHPHVSCYRLHETLYQ